MVTICLCLLGLSFHLIFVNYTIMKKLRHLENLICEKHSEEMYLLNAISDNQERSKLSQLIKDKPKQFIRRPQ